MYKFYYYFFIFSTFFVPFAFSLQCLVIRPGYGLVTESCPIGSAGCRIRISKDAVDFYEYSALYDRNQYVCVHKTEFDEAKQSGCLRKKNGRVRCWCHGRSNCNTAEASKALYEAYITDDKDYFNKVIREIDDSPEVTDFLPSKPLTTTPSSPEVVKVPIVSKHNSGGMLRGGSSPKKTSEASGSILMGNSDASPFVRQPGSKKLEGPQKPSNGVKDIEGESVFSKSSSGTEHKLRHHHYRTDDEKDQSKRLATSRGSFSNKRPEEVQRNSMLVNMNEFPATLHPTIKPTTTTSTTTTEKPKIEKINNEIHVITVGAQDQYDLQNPDSGAATFPRALPTEMTPSDDLYDEEELAKMDAEFAQRQRKQNRPEPIPESPMQPIRVLPQEDEDVTEEIPESDGEYFDDSSAPSFSISLALLIFIRVL